MKKWIVFLIILSIAIALCVYILGEKETSEGDGSIHGQVPRGLSEVVKFLRQNGFSVDEKREAGITGLKSEAILVMCEPVYFYLENEKRDEIKEWLIKGHNLLYLARTGERETIFNPSPLFGDPSVTSEPWDKFTSLRDALKKHHETSASFQNLSVKIEDIAISQRLPVDGMPLIQKDGAWILYRQNEGKGAIFQSITPSFLENQFMSNEGNRRLAYALFTMIAPQKHICFDEYIHGYFAKEDKAAGKYRLFFIYLILYGIMFYFILLWHLIPRFGDIKNETVVPLRLSGFLGGIAAFMESGKHSDFVKKRLESYYLKRLRTIYGIGINLNDIDKIEMDEAVKRHILKYKMGANGIYSKYTLLGYFKALWDISHPPGKKKYKENP